ncbi:MAG: hypothetical protein MJZ17_00905 [Bacteroidales bacterium]|nr:hypothetical protein [Bacteroidales bacterium]
MRIDVIDVQENKWILGKVCLWEYLESLDVEDFNYNIQRGIVNNPYLDSILLSVKDNNPIPPISLVSQDKLNVVDNVIYLNSFDILDGLQRTYRLWIYKKITETANIKRCYDYKKIASIVRENVGDYSKAVSTRQIRSLFDRNHNGLTVWNLQEKYKDYGLYLYIWVNLSDSEVVKKMLILNAGQKRMAISHQYELMYLKLFKKYQSNHPEVKLYRSKDLDFNRVKSGNRIIGEYNIPTIIIGMESLVKGEPVRLSSDLLFDKLSSDGIEEDGYIGENSVDMFFSVEFIHNSIDIIYALDSKLAKNDIYNKWYIKDTTISGIMAGIGHCIRSSNPMDEEFAFNCRECALQYIENFPEHDPFDLKNFNHEYESLSSVKINIGIIVRKAICLYTINLIKNNKASWKEVFSQLTSKD